jgi:hypothetical protein
MRYQVPQFITIEDKSIGPFTLKQFLIYVGAVMVLVPVFLSTSIPLFITIAVPALATAAGFAHFKLHGRSLFTVIGSAIGFATRGQLFLWRREDGGKLLLIQGEEYQQYHATEVVQSLSDRARSLEAVGNVVNEDVVDEIDPDAAPAAVGPGPSTRLTTPDDTADEAGPEEAKPGSGKP